MVARCITTIEGVEEVMEISEAVVAVDSISQMTITVTITISVAAQVVTGVTSGVVAVEVANSTTAVE